MLSTKPIVDVLVVAQQFTPEELKFLSHTLNHPNGFGKIARFEVRSHPKENYFPTVLDTARFRIVVVGKFSSDQIQHVYPLEHNIQNMSFTFMNTTPPMIVFNKMNWHGPPPRYKVSLKAKRPGMSSRAILHRYRTYLVNHEFGHAMGLGHERNTLDNCPVMFQHTRGVGNCANDTVWPSKRNLRDALAVITKL